MTDNVPAVKDEQQLAVQSAKDIAASQDVIDSTTNGSGFLPYLQLFTAKSTACTEGKIPIGHWGLVQDGEIEDLTEEVNVLPISARPRAYQKHGDGNIVVIHDKGDPEYARIRELQANKVNGCMVGPEVLVFLETPGIFASFFCGSPTLRREAKKFKPLFGKPVTMRSKLIDNGSYKWHGPVIRPCSAGLDPFPSEDEIAEERKRFANPPKPQIERASDTEDDAVER